MVSGGQKCLRTNEESDTDGESRVGQQLSWGVATNVQAQIHNYSI